MTEREVMGRKRHGWRQLRVEMRLLIVFALRFAMRVSYSGGRILIGLAAGT